MKLLNKSFNGAQSFTNLTNHAQFSFQDFQQNKPDTNFTFLKKLTILAKFNHISDGLRKSSSFQITGPEQQQKPVIFPICFK